MRHSFATSVSLEVRKPVADITDVEEQLISALMVEWKRDYEAASNASYKGNLRLEQHLEDNEITTEIMSQRLNSIKPYGMAEMMRV